MQHLQLRVHGKVQGVFFRRHTQQKARKLKLVGSVQNLADGSVQIFAEGEKTALDQLLTWAQQGSPLAHVEKLEVVTRKTINQLSFSKFDILT